MSQRYNATNNGGVTTVSGGNMPTSTYTNNHTRISRSSGQGNKVASPTVTANGHAVEQGGDGGCWDTVTGAIVDIDKTNIGCINL